MTPEGKIKAKVDRILNNTDLVSWYFKPVQSGYGKRALDYICCIAGRFVAIETKAPGEEPTPFQRITAWDMHMAGAHVWFVSSDEGVDAFERWLNSLPHQEIKKGASW